MKKLLAILLTLIFAFSCFSTLGTTAMAEEAVGVAGEKVNSNSDFATEEGRAKWAVRNTTATFAQDGKGGSYYATIKSSATNNALLYTPTFKVWSGATYEISYYVRVTEGSAIFPAKKTPSAGVSVTKEVSEENVRFPDATKDYTISKSMYAHNGVNKALRGIFEGHWYYGDEPFYYECAKYSDLYQESFLSKASKYGANANEIFNGWKKMVFRFTATGSDAMAAFVFYVDKFADTTETNFLGFDVKDIVVKQTSDRAPSGAMLSSDFDGINDIKESRWVVYAKDATTASAFASVVPMKEADGGFVRINAQNGITENTVSQKSAIRSSTFAVVPGNKYKISFKIRVPEQENNFLDASYSDGTKVALAPGFTLYQNENYLIDPGYVNKNSMTGEYSTINSDNGPAYSFGNTRRGDIAYNWTVNGKTVTKKTYSISESSPTTGTISNVTGRSPLYSATLDADGNLVSPNTAFAEWTEVSVEFVAKEESGEEYGTKQVVQMEIFLAANLSAAYHFDVKDIAVYETPFTAEPEQTDDVVFYQGFEDVSDFEKPVVVYQGRSGGQFGAGETTWAKPTIKIDTGDAATGRRYYSVNARSQQMFIPFNDVDFKVYNNSADPAEKFTNYYNFSFNWKLDTAGDAKIATIALVGYNDEVTAETQFGSHYTVIARANTSNIMATGNWETTSFGRVLFDENKYNYYGIVISYQSNEDIKINLDTITLKQKALRAGDYTLDEKTQLDDVAVLAKYFAGWEVSDARFMDDTLADVSGDGNANLYDLVKIAQIAAKW